MGKNTLYYLKKISPKVSSSIVLRHFDFLILLLGCFYFSFKVSNSLILLNNIEG